MIVKIHRIWIEFIALFICLPLVVFAYRVALAPWLLIIIVSAAIACFLIIYTDNSFKRFRLTNTANLHRLLWRSPITFVVGAILTSAVYIVFVQGELFSLPLYEFDSWLLLLFVYPLLSAWPQELIFRTYFFHRYKKVMPNKTLRILVSALIFSFAHIIYANIWAVVLSFIGGLIFSYTYVKSRSTIACVIEHSVWGIWLFSLGLGQYLDLSQTL